MCSPRWRCYRTEERVISRMRKGIIKIVVLFLVFCLTVAVMGERDRQSEMDLKSEMASVTLPVVYFMRDDVKMNQLYGYSSQMDATAVRDTITPLREDLTLPLVVRAYQNHIENISFEVRSMDMQRLVEDGEIGSFSQKDGEIRVELKFENILEQGTEYMLELTVNSDGAPIYYYTRIIREENYYVDETLDLVMSFHEQSLDKKQAGNLALYLEPNSQGDNSTLHKVTINSSLAQVSWAEFTGERLEQPVASVKELGSSYNTVTLRYIMTATGDGGGVEYYTVEEYYRVRYNSTIGRMSLLNYERDMNQVFRGENHTVNKNKLLLGIRPENVDYMTNEKGTIVAFVQEGELWSYNSDSHELFRIFSFRSTEGISDRENNGQHDIRIMRMDESGSMDFAVYGYMNRGSHEGMTGISVFHYDSVGNTVEESLFMPANCSYEMLKANWGEVFYISDKNMFYLLADGQLYRINLEDCRAETVIRGMQPGSYVASENGRYIAWQDLKDDEYAQAVKIMDLEDETTRTIEGTGEEYLKPIGFVESDFVYGSAKETEVMEDTAGNTRFLMYKVTIVDNKSQVIKEYQKDGFYISNAYVEQDTIFLDRELRTETGFIPADQDTIKNQQLESSRLITVDTIVTEKKQTQVELVFAEEEAEGIKNVQVKAPKEVVVEEQRTVELESSKDRKDYYVYSAGRIVMSTPSVMDAILCADENAGVVIDGRQKYIWRRGRKPSQPMIGPGTLESPELSENSVVRCLTYLLQEEESSIDVEDLIAKGETPRQILTEALMGCDVVDLSGCSVSQVLYYVNLGNPVLAMLNDEAALIVGYDEHNTILYQPAENTAKKMGLQDSDAFFSGAGNVFLGYIK